MITEKFLSTQTEQFKLGGNKAVTGSEFCLISGFLSYVHATGIINEAITDGIIKYLVICTGNSIVLAMGIFHGLVISINPRNNPLTECSRCLGERTEDNA